MITFIVIMIELKQDIGRDDLVSLSRALSLVGFFRIMLKGIAWLARHRGACLWSQHFGDQGRKIMDSRLHSETCPKTKQNNQVGTTWTHANVVVVFVCSFFCERISLCSLGRPQTRHITQTVAIFCLSLPSSGVTDVCQMPSLLLALNSRWFCCLCDYRGAPPHLALNF